ncbi:MAG: MBL fold metallo-hydrolase [Nanoarchaeota archaeon]|nr:MBL fold metallo-hydrolase [Nanoarchaeota archaeon]
MESKRIANKVWKIYGGKGLSSNVYLVDVIEPTLIDLGSSENTLDLVKILKEIGYEAKDIVNIVFTHLHLDHTGQPSRFENARFYASREEIESFKDKLKKIKLEPLGSEIAGMNVIKTPGHTVGSVCLLLQKEKILFSGDTIFDDGYGRVDLETSVPEKMNDSLERLKKLKYKILCPGH